MTTTSVEAAQFGDLRELASFRAVDGLAISAYAGFDPVHPETEEERGMRVASVLAEVRRRADAVVEPPGHAARLALESDLEWIAEQLQLGLGPGSVACFAAGADGFRRSLTVPGRFADAAAVGARFSLVPLVQAGSEPDVLVAVVGRERGEIHRLRSGRLEKLADLTEKQPRKHRDGSPWDLPRQMRHLDELTNRHLRETAAALERALHAAPGAYVVIAGAQESAVALRGLLPRETQAAVAGIVHPDAHASSFDLIRLVLPVVERRAAEVEDELVKRLQTAVGTGGNGVEGWERTLAAAADGRVELLLYAPAAAGARPEALDLAVRDTLAHGGGVRRLGERSGATLATAIGALLGF